MPSLRFLALTVVLLAVACGERNPNFCEGAACDEVDASPDAPPITCAGNGPDTSCPADNPVCESGECTGSCTADTDCAGRPATERVCHMMSGACVECDENNTQATPGQAEDECPAANNAVCDGDTHTCRPCEAHSECFAGVCDAGMCVPQANIIFLTPAAEGGTDSGGNDCLSASTGCLTLNYAIGKLTATRKYILFKPSATAYPARNNTDRADFNGVTAHLIGYGATVNRSGAGLILDVHGGSDVTIEGLTISNGGGSGGTGVLVSGARLALHMATLKDNGGFGVDAANTSTLRVTRTKFLNNDAGGIRADATDFVIINNIIATNGDSNNSTVGGVSLASAATNNVFEFNTVTSNAAAGTNEDGVQCTNATLVARNNIITGAMGKAHVGGNCNFTYTLFAPDMGVAGNGNMTIADIAMFMFTADFHIGAGSVAAAKADSTNLAGETLVDIDGHPRTLNGTTVDVGADEIP